MARVVSDGSHVMVVTAHKRWPFRVGADGIGKSISANKFSVPVVDADGEEDVLTVVASGGCLCGKPWMKHPSDAVLLAEAASRMGVSV